MRHKHADLLIYAAENADAEFISDYHESAYPISFVLITPQFDWRIKPKAIKKWQWAYKLLSNQQWKITHYMSEFETCNLGSCELVKLEFTEIEIEE